MNIKKVNKEEVKNVTLLGELYWFGDDENGFMFSIYEKDFYVDEMLLVTFEELLDFMKYL